MTERQRHFKVFADAPTAPLREPGALPVVTNPQELPLDRLDWKAFEQLCCRLVARMRIVEGEPYLYGLPGQAQRGIDIVARVRREGRLERWGFQCRRVQRMTPSALDRAIEELDYEADHFVILLASSAGTTLQDAAEAMEAVELWDAQVLSNKLKAHPDLVADFFGPHWAAYFGDRVEESKPNLSVSYSKKEETLRSTFSVPRPDQGFVGRERELDELNSHLGQMQSITIEGPGGIGKTQLLINALEIREAIDERRTIWIDGEAFGRVKDTELALMTALRHSGFSVPEGEYLRVLRGAPVRIVFDGVEQSMREGDEFIDFLHMLLTQTRSPQFVFTSQVDLSPLRTEVRIQVAPLSAAETSLLLTERGDCASLEPNESGFIRELVAFSEGHPLTIHLVAAQLRRYGTAAEVVKRLRAEGSQILKTPGRHRQTRRTSLHLALSLAYSSLTEQQRRSLRCLAHFPGGAIDRLVDIVGSSVAKAEGEDKVDVLDDLGELHRWHLVQRRVEGQMLRYRLLEPLRAFVLAEAQREQALDLATIRYEIAHHLGTWAMIKKHRYLQLSGGPESTKYGLMRFDSELSNYLVAVEYIREDLKDAEDEQKRKLHEVLYTLISGLTTYLFVRGILKRGAELLHLGIRAGREAGFSCAELFLMLVRIQGRMQDGKGVLETTEAFREAVSSTDDPEAEANFFIACADVAEMTGDYEEADRLYQQAEMAYGRLESQSEEEKDLDDPQVMDLLDKELLQGKHFATAMMALVIAQRARMRENLGDFTVALELGRKALRILHECGDGINPPSVLFHIARAHEGLDDLEQALEAYTLAAAQFFDIGTTQYLSNCVAEIGSLLTSHEQLNQPSFSAELISAALNDVAAEAVQAVKVPGEAAWMWGGEVVRKAFSIMALASYSPHAHCLHQWGLWLREYIVKPYVEAKPPTEAPTELAGVVVREIDLIAVIALNVAELPAVKTLSERTLREISALCRELVALNYDPFLWLAKWVGKKYPEWEGMTVVKLRQMAAESDPYRG